MDAAEYEVLAFGAKMIRRRGQPQVEHMTVTEPARLNGHSTTVRSLRAGARVSELQHRPGIDEIPHQRTG